MFCPKCGKELPDDYKACPSCGFSFENFNTPKPEPKEQNEKHIHIYNENSGCLNDIVKVFVFIFVFVKIGSYIAENPTEKIYDDIFYLVIIAAIGGVFYFVISKVIDKYWPDDNTSTGEGRMSILDCGYLAIGFIFVVSGVLLLMKTIGYISMETTFGMSRDYPMWIELAVFFITGVITFRYFLKK